MIDRSGIFEVGHRYENRKGAYEVIGIKPPQIRIRYDSGEVINADLATQARIIENMHHPTASADTKSGRAHHSHSTGQLQRQSARAGTRAPSGHAQSESRRASGDHSAIEFSPGQIYRRRDLNGMYRGQEQGGICTPRDFPIILLFTGKGGALYGYKDYWDDEDIFHYFGEGQLGDMEFIRGNRAIRDHVGSGKELHLFETIGNGDVRYISPMTCIGYHYVSDVPDAAAKLRTAIVFKLTAR